MLAINGALAALLVTAPASGKEDPNPLVDVRTVVSDAVLDVRYATPRNFLKEALYPRAAVYLRRSTARRLARAAAALRETGHRLVLYDGYRPLSIQRRMWELKPDSNFVADPKTGSRHNRGGAVDCGLADKDGRALPMPSEFDEFGPSAAHGFAGAGPEARRNAARLKAAMESAGFVSLRAEWWHYTDPDGKDWPLLDVSLAELP